MSFRQERFINNIRIEPGALITSPMTADLTFGESLGVGGVCEGSNPEAWRAVIVGGQETLWTSDETFGSFNAADTAARVHCRARLRQALREIFT